MSTETATINSEQEKKTLSSIKFAGFLGGVAIIVGTIMPWISFSGSQLFDVSSSHTTGIGFWGMGSGTIVFILGWLIIGAVFDFTFGIPLKTYMAALGLAAYVLTLAYAFVIGSSDLDVGVGLWVSLGGASAAMSTVFTSLIGDRNLTFGTNSRLHIDKLPFMNMVTAIAVALQFNLPYVSEISTDAIDGSRIDPSAVSSADKLFDINVHFGALVVSLLGMILVVTVIGQVTSFNPPVSLFLLFALPSLALNSIFIINTFTGDAGDVITRSGPGAAAWVAFIASLVVVAISVNSLRNEKAAA